MKYISAPIPIPVCVITITYKSPIFVDNLSNSSILRNVILSAWMIDENATLFPFLYFGDKPFVAVYPDTHVLVTKDPLCI